jgi:hypothetical protein
MSQTPSSGPDIDAVLRLQTELKDESPRGVVLISSAMLEEALRELIIAFLVPNTSSSDTLFNGPTSAFGSFSAKIDVAYRLGLISDKFCRDLHLIRRIRNDIAHNPESFSFESASAKERINALSQSHGIYARSPNWVKAQETISLKDQFLEAASWMLFYMAAEHERVSTLKAARTEFGYSFSMDESTGLKKE